MRRFLLWWRAPGRLPALAVLGLALIAAVADPAVIRATRLRGFDAMQRLWPLPSGQTYVEVVAIDEESLKAQGQWPWPRTLIADLVRRIAAGKPLVLGVDILFPEPDRFSPPLLARTVPDLPGAVATALAGLPSNDAKLGEAFGEVPTVLGLGADSDAPDIEAPQRVVLIRSVGGDPKPFLTAYTSLIRARPEISRAVRSEAALNTDPDEDGVVRSIPLLNVIKDRLIPAFALEVVRTALNVGSIEVEVGRGGIASVGSIATDRSGHAYLHFMPARDDRYVSAAKVLEPGFDTSQFDGKIVLLAVTGLGILDQKLTPFGLMQGVEVHAQMIDSILNASLLQRPAGTDWIELAMILAAGLVVIGLVRYETPTAATAGALAIAIGLLGGEFALFRFAGWLVDGIYPAIVTLFTFGTMLGGNLRAAQIARRRLAAELERVREIAARTEGELAAARAIQMALLPLRFPAFEDRSDIDLYARIEPARAVGGDLFDFLLIDETHLFFIIADVSGKGPAAAIFMAMTKEIVRAAVQRYGSVLEDVLAEANGKTAAASAEMDMMFVTAFAGILDVASGELVYASAGHDRPFLLRDGSGLRQLDTPGGPPLGVVADFPFPIEHARIEGGTVLLLYTDGVTEAQDDAGALYSSARLTRMLTGMPAGDARFVVDGCFESVRQFAGDAEQADDITVLAIRRAAG